MSDIKIFRFDKNGVKELKSHSVEIEKKLQSQIERNLETFLGVRFLSSEYSTGKTHGGRIDTLGIDENGSPVIIEYKRALNQNVINQGLFYLDWLLDHQAEFKLLVMEKLGKKEADEIDWDGTRLLCIAGDFTKYDEHAIKQMSRNIELIKFRYFGDDLLLFERVNIISASTPRVSVPGGSGTGVVSGTGTDVYIAKSGSKKTVEENLNKSGEQLKNLYDDLSEYILSLGDDIEINTKKLYFAYKRFKNFACVEVHPAANKLVVFVKVDPKSITLEPGFTKDFSNIGHYGTGDLEITIASENDLEKAKPLIQKSYEAN